MSEYVELTMDQKFAIDQIWNRVHRARYAVHLDYRTPKFLHVSPYVFRLLCPEGPIFVYAMPYPRLMGLEVRPDLNLRGFDVAVTVQFP